MPKVARNGLTPWIENLILRYQEGSRGSERLKAQVIGVGLMSRAQGSQAQGSQAQGSRAQGSQAQGSQAQGSQGPTGLLFLTDGLFQIPAVLTPSAWEKLQELEDRDCLASLINTTVWIQDYQLQFYMALEQTKCRFFLSVGELASTAAGQLRGDTPCSTTLLSVRTKIVKTWKALQSRPSQQSQCGLDLSELLGDWGTDSLKTVLRDIKNKMRLEGSCSASQQPSTSTYKPSLTHPDTLTAENWDSDRVTYRGEECFSAPIKCLLIPEKDARQLHKPLNAGSRKRAWLSAPEAARPSADDVEWQIAQSAVVKRDQEANKNSPSPVEDSMLHEGIIDIIIDDDIRPLANPWDIFPPPSVDSSSTDLSPEASPSHSLQDPTATDFKSVILTSTQLPVHSSKGSLQTPKNSKGEHSYLPPYQKLQHSTSIPAAAGSSSSASVSPPEPFTLPSDLLLATEECQANTAKWRQTSEEETERKYIKPKRKKCEPTAEALATVMEEEVEEAQMSTSPPSWLFDSHAAFGTEGGSSQKQGQTAGTVLRKSPTVHSDGKPFSYTYKVSGQNLQDFSEFKVPKSLVHWAVEYLVAPKKDNPQASSSSKTQE